MDDVFPYRNDGRTALLKACLKQKGKVSRNHLCCNYLAVGLEEQRLNGCASAQDARAGLFPTTTQEDKI